MSTTSTTTTTWTIDNSHTLAEFSVKHMMISTVRGQFRNVTGTIELNEADFTQSSVNAEIEVASLTTRDDKRDAHLASSDFFEVETYPTITFKSTRIEKADDDYKVYGDLTIRGVTKPIVLKAEFNGIGTSPWGSTVAGFSADTQISRKEFGLEWNVALEAGGVLVGDQVKIHLEVEAIKG